MFEKYFNFLQKIIFIVLLSFLPLSIHAQCAGVDANLSVCDFADPANEAIDLFGLLGSASSGGIWSDDDSSGGLNAATGVLNAHLITRSGIYQYTYTVIDGGCIDNSSIVTVTIGGYTGKPTFAVACTSLGNFNLFQAFDGTDLSPHSNGQWHNDTTNQNLPGFTVNVENLEGQYQFTYTMTSVGSCPAPPPATIFLTVYRAPESGDTKVLKVCNDVVSNYVNFDLFDMLTGADAGGVWRDVNARSTGELSFSGDHFIDLEKIYDRFGQGDFYFTYSVGSSHPICNPATTRVRIRIEDKLDFTGATVQVNSDICETEISTANYSIRITKGPAAIPNGNYYIEFNVSGSNGGTERVLANLTNGAFLFPIKSEYFREVGDFTINIIDIYTANSERACKNINNLSDVLHIYPIPDLSGAKITETTICQNNNASIVISDAIKIIDGIYDIQYKITGANNTSQNVRLTFTGGNASFTVPSTLNSQSGNAVITITNITHVISQCSGIADLTGNIIIDPLPDVASLSIRINDVCFGDTVSVSVSGLGSLTDITLLYILSGSNVSTVQTITLSPLNGVATFLVPSNLLLNTGTTIIEVTNLMNNTTTCNVNTTGVTDSFVLNPIPLAPLVNNQSFCKSDEATIANLEPNGVQYKWYDSPTSITPLIDTYVLQSENYFVKVTTAGCTSDFSMISVIINDIPAPELNSDGANFCGLSNPTIADLSNNTNVPSTIVWFDSEINGKLLPSSTPLIEQGRYYGFDFSDITNCLSNESIEVTVSLTDCDEVPNDFFIPDGFSPNGDGVNDSFVIPDIEFLYPNYTLEIFNRYGNGMFKGHKNKPGWDGINYKKEGIGSGVAPNGVYFYILNFNKDNKPPKQGRIYLNR